MKTRSIEAKLCVSVVNDETKRLKGPNNCSRYPTNAAKVPTVIEPLIAKYAPTPITIIGPISVTVFIAANEYAFHLVCLKAFCKSFDFDYQNFELHCLQ